MFFLLLENDLNKNVHFLHNEKKNFFLKISCLNTQTFKKIFKINSIYIILFITMFSNIYRNNERNIMCNEKFYSIFDLKLRIINFEREKIQLLIIINTLSLKKNNFL